MEIPTTGASLSQLESALSPTARGESSPPEPGVSDGRRRLFLVEDHALMRMGIAHLIGKRPEWELCGEADDCVQAYQLIRESSPDLAIIDLRLCNGDGLELIKRIRDSVSTCRMLVFSAHEEELFAERVLRAGAHGFVNKQEPIATVIAAIEKVLEGRIALSSRMTDRLLASRLAPASENVSSLAILSDREMEVFERLGRGMTAKEIARDLHLSIKTIEYHRQNIKEKLQLSGSSAVVRYATVHVLGRSNDQQAAMS
ncbi:response regulator [Planctomyces sp. SH-PL14]|uniref:response regulator n=1 Tax=Planctomyces sp. SH-PL14 TaxID=1632864 RepID=UPI00078D5E29|nr:response regulator transcription factor [Planctomyces sp. SH-PL14]AMV19594.1 Oxygen regulatory protein NreC [Planctomyces sp. SH-PL14]